MLSPGINPVLPANLFDNNTDVAEHVAPMTVSGTVKRTFTLVGLLAGASALPWIGVALTQNRTLIGAALGVGFLMFAIATSALGVMREAGRVLVPICAFGEGLIVGGLIAFTETRHPGIAPPIFVLSLVTVASTVVVWASQRSASSQIRLVVSAAVMSLAIFTVVTSAIHVVWPAFLFFPMPGIVAIVLLAFVLVAGTVTLAHDLARVRDGVDSRRADYLEWSAAFGLVLGVFWIFGGGVRGVRLRR